MKTLTMGYIVVLVLGITLGLTISTLHEVNATGGSATLAKALNPLIEEAQKEAHNGNIEAILELLQEMKEQTQDSYEVEKEE